MAVAYTKEFLIDAYLSRFTSSATKEQLDNLRDIATRHYDKVGKDKFRVSASLDAEAIKKARKNIDLKL